MNPKKLRAFSLYESQDEGRRGGRSKFRDFLASVGKTFRPVLNQLASGLASKGTRVLAKKLGNEMYPVELFLCMITFSESIE